MKLPMKKVCPNQVYPDEDTSLDIIELISNNFYVKMYTDIIMYTYDT